MTLDVSIVHPAAPPRDVTPVLDVRGLTTDLFTQRGPVRVVDGVDFSVAPGETLGIVGESGCGKSISLLSLLGALPANVGVVRAGTAMLRGRDMLAMSQSERRSVLGNEITMVAQDPMASLNPLLTIGSQIGDVLRAHQPTMSAKQRKARVVELLARVGIPEAATRAGQHPHQYSGGMLQRAMIAMAIANEPSVVLADEPTTALDVTVQAQILELVQEMQAASGLAVVLVTHDLGVVAQVAQRVNVMYAGRIVESGPLRSVFAAPKHPYTAGLLVSKPSGQTRGQQLWSIAGQPPTPARRPTGCDFHPRCAIGRDRPLCREQAPALRSEDGTTFACHFPDEVSVSLTTRERPPEVAPC